MLISLPRGHIDSLHPPDHEANVIISTLQKRKYVLEVKEVLKNKGQI